METFHHTIGLRMVWRGHDDVDPPCSRQLLKYGGCELAPSIRSDGGRDPEILDPSTHEGVDDGLGRDVDERDGDGPAGEPVNRSEKMSTAVGERECNEVEVYVVETPIWDGEVADWRHCVTSHFSALAVEALACPSGHVLTHGWPYDLRSDGVARTLDAGMAKSVDDIEDGLAKSQWYKWPCGTIADVHD